MWKFIYRHLLCGLCHFFFLLLLFRGISGSNHLLSVSAGNGESWLCANSSKCCACDVVRRWLSELWTVIYLASGDVVYAFRRVRQRTTMCGESKNRPRKCCANENLNANVRHRCRNEYCSKNGTSTFLLQFIHSFNWVWRLDVPNGINDDPLVHQPAILALNGRAKRGNSHAIGHSFEVIFEFSEKIVWLLPSSETCITFIWMYWELGRAVWATQLK